MTKIVPIVEGDGEVDAVPKLLFKILHEMGRYDIFIGRARNAKGCDNLKKPGGLETYIRQAWTESDCSGILILMDADDDCAKSLAESFSQRARTMGAKYPTVCVIAKHEYEAWLLASVETLAGHTFKDGSTLSANLQCPVEVETLSGIKGLFTKNLSGTFAYGETEHQIR
jgi:hypothetical protein